MDAHFVAGFQREVIRRDGAGAGEQEAAARKMNFAKEEDDDLRLNEVIWRSIRGQKSPMPPPVRAGFVFTKAGHGGSEKDAH